MEINVDVQGLSVVERKLRLLPDRLGNNAMRRALRKGANVIRNEARNNAKRIDDPVTREPIWKNIAVYGGGRRREDRVGGVILPAGVRGWERFNPKSASAPGGNTSGYWRLIEFGTSKMRAQPFMQPAAANKAQAAADAITKDMRVQVDREIDKLNRQIIDLTRAAGG